MFPVHPRTRKKLGEFGLLATLDAAPGIRLCEPVGYVQFMNLVSHSALCITDSGGCAGRDHLSGHSLPDAAAQYGATHDGERGHESAGEPEDLVAEAGQAVRGEWPHGRRPDRWDGHTAARCVSSLKKQLGTCRILLRPIRDVPNSALQ